MHRSSVALAALFLLMISLTPSTLSSSSPEKKPTEHERLYDQLVGMKIDPSRTDTVSDLDLVRDAGLFHLKQGTLYGCTPVDGRRVAALFIGEGTVSMKPPTYVEQQQLVRFYGQDSIRMEFNTLFGVVRGGI